MLLEWIATRYFNNLKMTECVLPISCCRDDYDHRMIFQCRYSTFEPTALDTTSDFVKYGPRARTPPRCEPTKRVFSLSEGDTILPVEEDSGSGPDSCVATEWISVLPKQQTTHVAFPYGSRRRTVGQETRSASQYERVFNTARNDAHEGVLYSTGSSTSVRAGRYRSRDYEYRHACGLEPVAFAEVCALREESPLRGKHVRFEDENSGELFEDEYFGERCKEIPCPSPFDESAPIVRNVLDEAYIAASSPPTACSDHGIRTGIGEKEEEKEKEDENPLPPATCMQQTMSPNQARDRTTGPTVSRKVQSPSHQRRRAGSLPDIGSPRPLLTGPPRSMILERFRALEANFALCEQELCAFEADARFGMETDSRVEKFSAYKDLARQIEALSAEALEMGCGRDMAGAMDLFEQANLALERTACLLAIRLAPEECLDRRENSLFCSNVLVPCSACFEYLRLPLVKIKLLT